MRLFDHIGKFEHFINVVDTGSISHGSTKSLIGQPQMSKIIRQLEDALGVKLFIRSKNGIKTTINGDLLYQHAKSILESTNTIDLKIRNQQDAAIGKIKVGTYDSIGLYFFPDFLKYLKKLHPKLLISIETNKSSALYDKVKKKELDIAVIVDAPSAKNLIIEKIYSDSFQLYSSTNSSFDCANRIIFFNGLKRRFIDIISKKQFNETIECDNIETVKSLTEEGLGIGILPQKVARNGVLRGKLQLDQSQLNNSNFIEHTIDLCSSKSEDDQAINYFKYEIKRYLGVWSTF